MPPDERSRRTVTEDCAAGRAEAGHSAWTRWLPAAALLWLNDVHRRLLGILFGTVGPRVAHTVTAPLARCLYHLLTPFRARCEAQLQAALGERLGQDEVGRVAERAFVHRVWNLVDLLLAERLLHPGTYQRYGGTIPQPHLGELLAAQRRRQPAILLTAYYGPFDLFPVFLGYNGVRAGVVYQPHGNRAFDRHRRRVRARGGCELIPVSQARDRLPRILEAGGTVAIIADHHAGQRGLPVRFLGLPTMAIRSVGLLAWRYDADVVVAGIRRINDDFFFEIEVTDVMKRRDWADQDDPIRYITQRYVRALERLVLNDPTQYIWGYARWGQELASRLVADASVDDAVD